MNRLAAEYHVRRLYSGPDHILDRWTHQYMVRNMMLGNLYLAQKGVTSVPSAINDMVGLKTILLGDNYICSTDNIIWPDTVEHIDLSANRLSNWPPNLPRDLKVLDLEDNMLLDRMPPPDYVWPIEVIIAGCPIARTFTPPGMRRIGEARYKRYA